MKKFSLKMQTRWRVTAFLGVAAALNYADRAAISAVFAPLQKELGLSDVALGMIGSVFLWSYAISSPFAGVLADRVSRSAMVAWSLGLWSLVALLTGMSNGLTSLIILRVCLGIAESLYLPPAIALLGDHHGPSTRGLAMGLHSVGLNFGLVLGGTFAGYLAQHYGWRSGFWVLGSAGIMLAFFARLFLEDGPKAPRPAAARPSFGVAFRYLAKVPSFHILLVKGVLAGVGAWIFINWLPLYFLESFKMSLGAAGFAGTFMLQISVVVGIAVGGWFSDRLATRDPRQRMLFQAFSYILAAPVLLLFLTHPGFAMVTATVSIFSFFRGLGQSNENPILCEVIPPRFRSTAVGFMNCCATAAGGVGVLIAGVLKARFGLDAIFAGISVLFLLAGALLILGYSVFMPRDIQRAEADAKAVA